MLNVKFNTAGLIIGSATFLHLTGWDNDQLECVRLGRVGVTGNNGAINIAIFEVQQCYRLAPDVGNGSVAVCDLLDGVFCQGDAHLPVGVIVI
jgi:hypothetical protein